MIFSIRDLSFEFGSVLLEGWFALAARAGCALLILLAAWLVRRWLSKKGIPALLARKWHFNGTPICMRHRIWPTCCWLPAARRSAPTKHSALCWTPLTRCW